MTDNPSIQSILTSEFIQLDRMLKRFNVFTATDMRRREVKHTKFLAHLLDPHEAHGLGIRFLENFVLNLINEKGSESIDFFNLDLMNAEILSEHNLEAKGKKGKTIDLLIFIPSLSHESKNILIAIEAKVDSKESPDQLSGYRELIEEKFGQEFVTHYFFLTAHGEDPSDEKWLGVTFGNIVIPTIETLKQSYQDTISDYLISIIEDYVEIMDGNSSIENEANHLAEKIPQATLALIKDLKPNASIRSAERIIQRKFSAAVDFLKVFSKDPRKNVPAKFEQLFKNPAVHFKHETSSLKYLRMSFFDPENEAFLKSISDQSTPLWVSSRRNIALEFVLTESDKAEKMNVQLKLMLGPTNEDFLQRQDFVNAITDAVDILYSSSTKKSVSKVYSTLIGHKVLKNFTAKALGVDAVVGVIEKALISDELIAVAKVVNDAVTKFRRDDFVEN